MLEIDLFGSFRLTSDGRATAKPRSKASCYLLAILVLHHGRRVERAQIAGMLWPDATEDQSLYNLRRNLSDLRTVLGPNGARLLSPDRATMALDLDGARCDVVAYDAAILRGDNAALEEAISLYRGPLLEGCYEEWIEGDRRRREAEYLRALASVAAHAPATDAVRYYRLATSHDPSQEIAQRGLMQALGSIGDYAGAAKSYAAFRRYLRKELNSAPSAETAALHKKLAAAARRAVAVDSTGALDLIHLPIPATQLLGRTDERRAVARLLTGSRLVTLIGSGGVGKTRLCIAAAQDTAHEFSGGVWFVDFSAILDPLRAAAAVTAAVHAPPAKGEDEIGSVARYIGNKPLLIVFDNCEQIRDGAARVAARLLQECPNLRLLASSRVPIGIKPEVSYRVPSLPIPPKSLPADSLLGYASAALFVARARAVSPCFAIDDENAGAVASICSRLDGIPLAIELAASRVRTLSPGEIAMHLDERFRLLTTANSSVPRRRQTMQASIDWSWDLLGEHEKVCLRRLSVFAGTFDVDAAEGVAGADPIERWEVLDLLSKLLDWGLLAMVQPSAGGGPERYRLLETVRHYASERLSEAGDQGTHIRHRKFFLKLTANARPHMGAADAPIWMAKLDVDHDNLRAALDHALNDPSNEAAVEGLSIAHSLAFYWLSRGYDIEGTRRLEAALKHPGAQAVSLQRASALRAAAMLTRQHNVDKSEDLTFRALAQFQELGESKGVGDALLDLGNIALRRRRHDDARAYYEQSLEIYHSLGETVRANRALSNMSEVAFSLGDLESAFAAQVEMIAQNKAVDEKYGIAVCTGCLATIEYYRGNIASAAAHAREAVELLRQMGHRDFNVAIARQVLALTSIARGNMSVAREHLVEASSVCVDMDGGDATPSILDAWGTFFRQAGNCSMTARLLGASDANRVAADIRREVCDGAAYEADVAHCRRALSDDVFERERQFGAAMSWREALQCAITARVAPSTAARKSSPPVAVHGPD